jgi:hypothetical protein
MNVSLFFPPSQSVANCPTLTKSGERCVATFGIVKSRAIRDRGANVMIFCKYFRQKLAIATKNTEICAQKVSITFIFKKFESILQKCGQNRQKQLSLH